MAINHMIFEIMRLLCAGHGLRETSDTFWQPIDCLKLKYITAPLMKSYDFIADLTYKY